MDPDNVYDLVPVPDSTVWSEESNSPMPMTVLMVEDENGNIVEEEYFPNNNENITRSTSSSSRSSRFTPLTLKQNFKVPHLLQRITRQERQLSRIQQDQVRRTEEYKEIELKLQSGNFKLQNQINEIRREFSHTSETLGTEASLLNTRLFHCEQKQAQTRDSVESEFQALRNVMALVCDSINRIEERNGAEQACLYRGQQQQQSSYSQLQDPQQSPDSQLQDPLVTFSDGIAESPAPVSVGSSSSTETISPVSIQPGRVECPLCSKTLSKYYVRSHIKAFCKKRVVS